MATRSKAKPCYAGVRLQRAPAGDDGVLPFAVARELIRVVDVGGLRSGPEDPRQEDRDPLATWREPRAPDRREGDPNPDLLLLGAFDHNDLDEHGDIEGFPYDSADPLTVRIASSLEEPWPLVLDGADEGEGILGGRLEVQVVLLRRQQIADAVAPFQDFVGVVPVT